MDKKIRALFIFEILGRPPEHIKETLEVFVDKLEQKGVEIISKKVHEPKPIERKEGDISTENLFTTFAEAELVIDNLNLLFSIILSRLPASVEIIEPSSLILKNFDLTSVVSELSVKLHRYDEVAKILMVEKNNLTSQISQLQARISELEKEKISKPKKVKKDKKK